MTIAGCNALVIGSLAVALSLTGALSSLAQTRTAKPTTLPVPQAYVEPYAAFAYSPGAPFPRNWKFPAATTGQSLWLRDLNLETGVMRNPCFLNHRIRNRC
jgi:hypothetical protein